MISLDKGDWRHSGRLTRSAPRSSVAPNVEVQRMLFVG